MHKFKDWKEFINRVLIDSGQFENPTSELRNETEIETFKSAEKNCLTEIRAGYLKENLLIYLEIFNPQVLGYNKYVEGEYFDDNSFDLSKKQTKVGLDFNKVNTTGITKMLERGWCGSETQYILNGKILASEVDAQDENYTSFYDFTKRNFFERLFSKSIKRMDGIEKKEIALNDIFGGIKNVLQQNL